MKIMGLIGPSGTGKSHHALVVAYEQHLNCLLDDGLLIYHNRIIAGISAKEETNRMQAVRRAIFLDPVHRAQVRQAIEKIQPAGLLILGTSAHMVQRICENLQLPSPLSFISITDVSCAADIAEAQRLRKEEGKHIIPVPVLELRPHFRGYLLDPVRSWWQGRNGRKAVERSVVRPLFSYYGKLSFANAVPAELVRHCVQQLSFIAAVHKVHIDKRKHSERNGIMVTVQVSVYYGVEIKKEMVRMKQVIQEEIEYSTGMVVEVLEITVRHIVVRRQKHRETMENKLKTAGLPDSR